MLQNRESLFHLGYETSSTCSVIHYYITLNGLNVTPLPCHLFQHLCYSNSISRLTVIALTCLIVTFYICRSTHHIIQWPLANALYSSNLPLICFWRLSLTYRRAYISTYLHSGWNQYIVQQSLHNFIYNPVCSSHRFALNNYTLYWCTMETYHAYFTPLHICLLSLLM